MKKFDFKKYRQENKDKYRKYNRDWAKRHPERIIEMRWATRDKLRRNVLYHYGNKCVCCGITNYEFLCIDHINNDGAKQRRDNKLFSAQAFYTWLRKNNYPSGYQILCYNCNCAKAYYQKCPHKV